MIGNVNQPSTNQIMDVDGTLKAGAVDVAAVLANNVVETAKIADDAVTLAKLQNITRGNIIVGGTADAPTLLDANDSGKILVGDGTDLKSVAVSGQATLTAAGALTLATNLMQLPNQMWDSFNEYFDVGEDVFARTSPWLYTANLSIVTPDANNPFVRPTLRLAAAGGYVGKRIHLSESDGAAIGDAFTVVWTCRGNIDSARLYCYWFDAVGAVLGQANSAPKTLDGNVQTLTATGTIPATATYAEISVIKTGTANAFDTYHVGFYLGAYETPVRSGSTADITPHIARMVEDRSAGANLLFDPYNVVTGPGAVFGTTWNGRNRFYNSANMTIVSPDASNPFSGKTLRIGTGAVFAGKILYLDECGLRANDYFTASFACSVASGTFRIFLAYYNSSNALVTNYNATSVSATGALQVVNVTRQIPATTAYMTINLYRTTGAADIDIYAMSVVRGRVPAAFSPSLLDGSPYFSEITDARGAYESLEQRLDSIDGGSGFSSTSDTYGLYLLKSWRAKRGIIASGGTGQAKILCIGDSWVYGMADRLRVKLQALYGSAGPGFQQFVALASYGFGGGIWTRSGTWTDVDQTAAAYGPGVQHMSSVDIATPAAVSVVATANTMTIHYGKQAGGGSFRFRVDAGGWTTVDTDAAAAYATEVIGSLSTASHTLEIEVTVAGAGVILVGVDCALSANGVRINWCGNGGASAESFSQVDETIWSDAITALTPDVVIILLGTNDHSGNVLPATFATRINAVVDRIQAALPLTDIVLLAPSDNGLSGRTYTVSEYVDELRGIGVAQDAAVVDAYMNVGPYADGNSRALYANTSHPNDAGYDLLAQLLLNRLQL